ncbi:MAG: PilZ domain-containing protein [Desulfobacterales bacterium]|nr:PilZ domain-containing protein [Desulfobacterales bacterium]
MSEKEEKEKRKYSRVDAPSLSSTFVCIDKNNDIIKQGTCRTLNVSESGLLLETDVSVDLQQFFLLTIPIEEDIADIKGKVVRCLARDDGKYEVAIEFMEIEWLYNF